MINIDLPRIREVIDNLISNAKYSPIESAVYIEVFDLEKLYTCASAYEGPGLTDDDTKVSKFQKLSARPTAGEHSTGPGLAIVKI